jgi:hypothetical protein
VVAKFLKKIGLGLAFWGVIKAIWDAIGHIGNVQTLWDMVSAAVQYWPNILRGAAWVVTSWWFPLIASMICLASWRFLSKKPSVTTPPSDSRIKIRCGKDVEGCIVPDHRGIWYRARLDLTDQNVAGLEASILGLWEDGRKVDLYGEYLIAQMCMSEQLGQTTLIREGRPEFINLVFGADDTEKPPVLTLKHYPGSLGDRAYLKLNHEYQMDMVLNCDGSHPAVPFSVKLKLESNKDIEEFQLV